MTKLNQIYKCDICGNIVEVIHSAEGQLVCCGQSMQLLEENKQDAALEKHVPIIEQTNGLVRIKVGEVPHPMEEVHYIEWIELVTEEKVYRKYLNPEDSPEAIFNLNAENITARAYCNLHELWSSK
ncbi:desulfoferrodoxin [Candidatus Gracilibacteria bacterium]|nr:desulfoferrodoxin [Candidatus Gracilibacteria bacterium]